MADAEEGTTFQSSSVCLIGCGLLGTSLAMALRRARPDLRLIGVEILPEYREIAERKHVFDEVRAVWPTSPCDLLVLATPPHTAAAQLRQAKAAGSLVMDVCSIKRPLCDAAKTEGMEDVFAPTHPMAGLAAAGPELANAELFDDQPWLLLEDWPACRRLPGLIQSLGARVVWVANAAEHDAAMAVVSHAIHLTSLSAMLAYQDAATSAGVALAAFAGPAFRDITRLAGSPSGFWVDTLLANAEAVLGQTERVMGRLALFAAALRQGDPVQLASLLDEAREARERWSQARDGQTGSENRDGH